MPAKTQGRVTLGVTEGRAPWGAQRKGYRQRHRGKERCRGSQIPKGKVPGHRERDACIRSTEGRGAMGGHTEKGRHRGQGTTCRQCAPSLLCPCEGHIVQWKQEDKEHNLIKAIQKKEVRNGSRERFVVPQQEWVLPRLGSRLHMRSCKRLCPFFTPT